MTSFEALDALSTRELHDRAIAEAKRRHDAKFLKRLLEITPEAEAVSGNLGEADNEILDPAVWLHDVVDHDEATDEALRPVYLDYLAGCDQSR